MTSSHATHWQKRVFDLVGSALALVVLLPLLLLTALLVRIGLGRPVLFRQIRPGRNGAPFTMVKFRTMRDAVDAQGAVLPDAQRLTRFGTFLRSTSLDELPELWNVLRGEMSLVGPRPLLMEYLPRYSPEQARRHDVRPGITGWAQVNGSRGPVDTPAQVRRRLKLDLEYVSRASLWLDLQILVRTAPMLFGDMKATR
jgi:lipopolysaccharide/colanic/teichoic acid biosynthesis glycosyltransferase